MINFDVGIDGKQTYRGISFNRFLDSFSYTVDPLVHDRGILSHRQNNVSVVVVHLQLCIFHSIYRSVVRGAEASSYI